MKLLGLVCASLLIACGGRAAEQPASTTPKVSLGHAFVSIPAGSLRADRVALRFGVYLTAARPDARAVAEELARKELAEVTLVPEPSAEAARPWIFIGEPPIADYAPPNMERLQYSSEGLPEAEWPKVASSPQAIVMMIAVEGGNGDALHRRALAYVAKLAEQLNGYPWDDETRQVFSRESWREERLSWTGGVPNVTKHVTMHAYRDGELIRIVTLGMSKLGYPDVVANQVATGDTVGMGNLINLVCQTLVEQGGLAKTSTVHVSLDRIEHPEVKADQNKDLLPNATRSASIAVGGIEPEEGDAENRLMELFVLPVEGETPQVTHNRVISQIYGSRDEVVYVDNDHPEVQAARARARAELMQLKPHITKGFDTHEQLLVKAPFPTPDGSNEWMWVEVARWEGSTIYGILANDPFDIPDLKAGARVVVQEDEVFDYMHRGSDGKETGNLTSRVIERLSTDQRSK